MQHKIHTDVVPNTVWTHSMLQYTWAGEGVVMTKGFQPLIHPHGAWLFGHPAGCFPSLAHPMGSVCSSKNLPSFFKDLSGG